MNPSAEASSDPSAEPPSRHILSLPNEVLLAIFSFLDITNLPSVLGVCSRWREVITASRRWQMLDFTAVEDSGLHVKVAMAVGHQARRVLGAAPLGKVVEQVLRNCPNLVELSMPDAIIGVKILRDIIAMCPMIESITTCVRVFAYG
ncbi:S-phase kinase-associated protein 2, partial [Hyalella azteca]|uniref:S-phase kinase-associated protein 2 n=1 Tax=Hyalella azteca TaxID=294128 RepID=A0A8B7PC14_HYAAZ